MKPNCPVTIQDIINAKFIWGPNLGYVKGKTVRHVSPKVRVENTSIPIAIMQQYKNVTLSVDITKVTGVTFLMTILRHIKFGLARKLDSMENSHILKHFTALIGTNMTRGLQKD